MAWSLDWFAASESARAGVPVRRVEWSDRVLAYSLGLWWIVTSTETRLVVATDMGEADLMARDWTTEPYDANVCGATPAFNTAGPAYRTWTPSPAFKPPPAPGFPEA